MTPFGTSMRFTMAIALGLPCLASLSVLAGPGSMAGSTYVVLATLLVALAAVALKTYANGQATGSLGQMLHETGMQPATEPNTAPRRARRTR